MSYSFRLAARVLLYASSLRQDSTYHGLCYTSHGTLAGTRNRSMGLATYRTMNGRSISEIHLAPRNYRIHQICCCLFCSKSSNIGVSTSNPNSRLHSSNSPCCLLMITTINLNCQNDTSSCSGEQKLSPRHCFSVTDTVGVTPT